MPLISLGRGCIEYTHRTYWMEMKSQKNNYVDCDSSLKGPPPPPPRHFARLLCNAQSSRRDTLWLFSFKFPAHSDTKFVTPGGTVLKLRNFLYMHVGPKMAPKRVFFTYSSYKYAYCFSIIVLQKVSATNFTEKKPQKRWKKSKKKGKKTKEIHKKFIKQ